MKSVYALYPDGESAQRAVNGLRAAGVADAEITVITSCPMEDFEFSHLGGKNRLWYVACFGGLVGFTASTSLVMFTETNWALNTGGMPVVAWWPNLIIMFEMTMLGAIVATFGWFLWESGLVRKRDRSAPVPAPAPVIEPANLIYSRDSQIYVFKGKSGEWGGRGTGC